MRVLLLVLFSLIHCEFRLSLVQSAEKTERLANQNEDSLVADRRYRRFKERDRHLASPGGLADNLDSMSLRLFALLRLKALAKSAHRSTRVMAAVGLAFMLVFFILFVAVQLQRAVVTAAYEESENQEPLIYRESSIFTDAAKA
jgi:hypothetical protein